VSLPKGVHKVVSRGGNITISTPAEELRSRGRACACRTTRTRRSSGRNFARPRATATSTRSYRRRRRRWLSVGLRNVSADTLYHYKRSLQIAKDAWGTLPIAGVRPSHVAELMKGLASTPSKANHFLATC
jgi:hypothetical protein